MKKLTLILALFAMTGIASAALGPNLLTNGDFEAGATGWSQWWGGNSGVPVIDLIEGDNAAGVYWSGDGIFQAVGTLAPGVYEFGGDLMTDFAGGLVDRRVVIQAEFGPYGAPWWVQQVSIGPGDAENVWLAATGDSTITLIDPTDVQINMFLVDEGSAPGGAGFYDNIYLSEVVPEPATMVLLGLGALVLRRKK